MNRLRDVAAQLLGLIEALGHVLLQGGCRGHSLVAADLLGLLVSGKSGLLL